MQHPRIVLLNSEGPIFTAYRRQWGTHIRFRILDQWRIPVAVWSPAEAVEWVHGSSTLVDSHGREWIYAQQPGSMKPDLRELDAFLGIDTEGKTY